MSITSRNRAQMLSLQDVADELNVSVRTVRRWLADGRLPHVRPSARVIRIRAEDLDAFIDAA